MAETKPATKYRNFPFHTLGDALKVAQTIRDVSAGRPMNRLLLADALKIKPSSSNYRNLLSSSLKYGLTSGTEKATDISLTKLGESATSSDSSERTAALRKAAVTPEVFGSFLTDYNNNKIPSPDMLSKVLIQTYKVPENLAQECAAVLVANGEAVGIVRPISGANHVLLNASDVEVSFSEDAEPKDQEGGEVEPESDAGTSSSTAAHTTPTPVAPPANEEPRNKPIFIGHGKKHGPRDKLTKILDSFKIPYIVAEDDPNLGRPIPVKVRDTILACGSAILIFTRDQKFLSEQGDEIWRPSENVVHELGATSFQYGDRVVIFKEDGIDLPSNFGSVGYISFEENSIESKTMELLSELVGFGLVKITAA